MAPTFEAGRAELRQRFFEFILDRETSRLLGPGGEVRLRPQAFRLLEVLLESAPKILTQNELIDRVWGVVHLSPASVKQAISELRLALGDDPARPRLIETVHRRGYRFIAPLEPIPQSASTAEPSAEPARSDKVAAPTPRPGIFRRSLAAAILLFGLAGIGGFSLLGGSLPWQETLPAVAAPRPDAAPDADRRKVPGVAPGALLDQAFVLQSQGKTDEARRVYERAIPVFREIGDRNREAKALNNLACLLDQEADFVGVARLLVRSLRIKREIGDLQGTALTLVNLGNVLRERGDVLRARSHFEEAIEISRRLGDAHATALALRGLSRLDAREGRFDEGRAALTQALDLSRQAGDAQGMAQAALARGDLERKARRTQPARAAYRAALTLFERLNAHDAAAQARKALAELGA